MLLGEVVVGEQDVELAGDLDDGLLEGAELVGEAFDGLEGLEGLEGLGAL